MKKPSQNQSTEDFYKRIEDALAKASETLIKGRNVERLKEIFNEILPESLNIETESFLYETLHFGGLPFKIDTVWGRAEGHFLPKFFKNETSRFDNDDEKPWNQSEKQILDFLKLRIEDFNDTEDGIQAYASFNLIKNFYQELYWLFFHIHTIYLVERISKNNSESNLSFIDDRFAQIMNEGEKIQNDLKKNHLNACIKRISKQLKIKKGGARIKSGYRWTNNIKILFYFKVANAKTSFWDYALKLLVENEFDVETIRFLMTRKDFKDISPELFNKAVKTWRKYLLNENWEQMPKEEKPRAFQFKQALIDINFPTNYKYSTLQSFYEDGKKLCTLDDDESD